MPGSLSQGCSDAMAMDAVQALVDTSHPDMWRLVPAGADVEALGRDLGLDPGVQAPRRAITAR